MREPCRSCRTAPPGSAGVRLSSPMPRSRVVIPDAVMDRHMHGHHIGRPLLTEQIARHATTVESMQRAYEPHRAFVGHGWRIASKWNPNDLVIGHYVSLRHLTSRDISYRFRR